MKLATNLVDVLEGVEDVVREAGEQVDDEPALQVVHADDVRVGHDLAVRADERRVEVEDDVDEEDDVDDAIDDKQRHGVECLVAEGDVERHHDGRVEGEDENHPVPRRLEGRVVQDDVRRRFWRLLPVLRQDVAVQVHHLRGTATGVVTGNKLSTDGNCVCRLHENTAT